MVSCNIYLEDLAVYCTAIKEFIKLKLYAGKQSFTPLLLIFCHCLLQNAIFASISGERNRVRSLQILCKYFSLIKQPNEWNTKKSCLAAMSQFSFTQRERKNVLLNLSQDWVYHKFTLKKSMKNTLINGYFIRIFTRMNLFWLESGTLVCCRLGQEEL